MNAARTLDNPFAQIHARGVIAIAQGRGAKLYDRHLSPCPACNEERRSRSDRRLGAVYLVADGMGWHCARCDAHGDAVGWLARSLFGEVLGQGDPRWRQVIDEGVRNNWCEPRDERPGRASSPSWTAPPPVVLPPKPWPDAGEIRTLLKRAVPASRDGAVRAWLAGRFGYDVGDALDRVVRALPANALPAWAKIGDRDWNERGYRALLPVFDATGATRSLRARALGPAAHPKAVPPTGYAAGGLVMASPGGREVLRGAEVERVVVAEGEPAFLAWCLALGAEAAVLGIVSGSWSREIAARVSAETEVIIATDLDRSGEQYADQIRNSLPRHRLLRWRSERQADVVLREEGIDALRIGNLVFENWTREKRQDNQEPPPEPAIPDDLPPEMGEDPERDPERLTDTGNAQRLVRLHGKDLLHCGALAGEGWLLWDGVRWKPDLDLQVERWCQDVANELHEAGKVALAAAVELDEIARKDAEKIANSIAGWANKTEMDRGINAILSRVKAEPGITTSLGQLDADPALLGVPNGIVDLRTGKLMDARREHCITKQAGAAYLPDAKAPAWERFLLQIMGGDASLVDYLRRLAGYTLFGGSQEQILVVLHGNGSNGKSTFVNGLRAAFGGYAQTASTELFLAKREGTIPNELAGLREARFVSASELREGRRLDEAFVKQVTGGDPVSARFLNREFFEFTPQFVAWLLVNHRPIIRGTDHGIWRRMRLIPFEVIIAEDEKDKELPDRLKAEQAGILAWAVRGCLEWQADGLQTPPKVQAAIDEYRRDMDLLAGFVEDRCRKEPEGLAPNTDLYESFVEWCRKVGEAHPWSHRRLTQELKARGFKQEVRRDFGRRWEGLTLLVRADTSKRGGGWAETRGDE